MMNIHDASLCNLVHLAKELGLSGSNAIEKRDAWWMKWQDDKMASKADRDLPEPTESEEETNQTNNF